MKLKKGFTIKGQGDVEVLIFGEIGLFGITAKEVIKEIRDHGPITSLNVRINSPGGEVFDGLAIFNFLNSLDVEITVQVDGVAASIASVIAMAGDVINMAENAMMMIHNPWAFAGGDAAELREMADLLEKVQENLIGIYEKRTGQTRDEIQTLLDAETWFTAEEAVDAGLADNITDRLEIAAKVCDAFDLSCFPNRPDTLKNKKPCTCKGAQSAINDPAPDPDPEPDPPVDPKHAERKKLVNELEKELRDPTIPA